MAQTSNHFTAEVAQRGNRRLVFFLVIFGLFLFLLISAAFWYNAGHRHGTEFSPDDFTQRRFEYNKDPIFGLILMGRKYTPATQPLEKSLITDGFIKPVITKNKKWVLTSFNGRPPGRLASDCDARFLTAYLDKRDENYDNVWSLWNLDYPNTAKEFWPVIAQMARDEMYLKIPDVMEFALDWKKEDPTAFKEQFDIVVADAYYELAVLDLQLNRLPVAKSRLKTSISFAPTDKAKTLLSSLK